MDNFNSKGTLTFTDYISSTKIDLQYMKISFSQINGMTDAFYQAYKKVIRIEAFKATISFSVQIRDNGRKEIVMRS